VIIVIVIAMLIVIVMFIVVVIVIGMFIVVISMLIDFIVVVLSLFGLLFMLLFALLHIGKVANIINTSPYDGCRPPPGVHYFRTRSPYAAV